jgi:hypothetical protein
MPYMSPSTSAFFPVELYRHYIQVLVCLVSSHGLRMRHDVLSRYLLGNAQADQESSHPGRHLFCVAAVPNGRRAYGSGIGSRRRLGTIHAIPAGMVAAIRHPHRRE